MKTSPYHLWLVLVLFPAMIHTGMAQPRSTDTSGQDKAVTGWNLGAIPIVLYNSDYGLQYGLLANLFDYGDGSLYPLFKHQFYFEFSRTTKGGGINQFFYDTRHVIPGVRTTVDLSYLTEKALDFYGFNGYEAEYNPDYEDDESDEYISRMYYKMQRKMLRLSIDFQGKFLGDHMRWVAGAGYFNTGISTVDIDALNKGRDEEDKLPQTDLLYDKYVNWGVISPDEKDGGSSSYIKFGLIFDTRDNEPNPMKGIWSEAILMSAPGFLGNKTFSFHKYALIHRQYFTLVKDKLSFVYRLAYQGTMGDAPFYLQSYRLMSFELSTEKDALGGSRTLRGIKRNRVVASDMAYSNLELRWKFYRTFFLRQNFYFAFNLFSDMGMATVKHSFDRSVIPDGVDFPDTADSPHVSMGAGLRIAMNQNFIIAVDYGKALDIRDGNSGVYVSLGYLF